MLALVIATLLGGSEAAAPQLWICYGVARGERGAELRAALTVGADGTEPYSVYWTPPTIAATARAAGLAPRAPEVRIYYDAFGSSQAGKPVDAEEVVLATTSEPALIEGSTVTLRIDGGRSWTSGLSWPKGAPDNKRYSSFEDPDLSDAVLTAREGEATLTAKDGRLLGRVRYDLSARAERDRLYASAMAAARRAVRTHSCEAFAADDGD